MAMAICLPPFVTDAMVSSQVLRVVHLLTPGNQDATRKLFVEHPQIRAKSSAPVRLFGTLSNHVTQLLTTFQHEINTQEMHPHKSLDIRTLYAGHPVRTIKFFHHFPLNIFSWPGSRRLASGEGRISPLAKWLHIIINIPPSCKKIRNAYVCSRKK
ncbi:hypothetical protein CFC21_099302 [Triticum aestivum]|uniref:Uncharacterized protein n=3 Tax=Triticum TaxID=4564 RepID=A0A3B6RK66_WHEAT|nr:hypothetical protein TRIUR3_06387 [Triticum urartu]KAF7097488.1 hypothetical protein CFC21_099302 [Triticum aestivum]